MAVAVPLALALVFAAAETTSELIGAPGGVADAGTPGGGRDNAMTNILSPQNAGGPNAPTGGNTNGRGRGVNGPASIPTVGTPGPGHTFGGAGGNPTDPANTPTPTPVTTTPSPDPTTPSPDPTTPSPDPTTPAPTDTTPGTQVGAGGGVQDTNTPGPGPTDTGTPVTIPVADPVTDPAITP
jgi:hypothetical protein